MQPLEQPYESPATAEDAVMGTLMALGRRMRQRLDQDTLDFSVVPNLKVLATCGAMRLSSLATALELDASTVSRHVKQLEDRGYLGRTTDPDDGRASQITVTDEGRDALVAHVARRKEFITKALAGWSAAERESLRDILDRFNKELNNQ
jgi:DNA-binding MarR family transcriptional regulator